MITNNSKSAQVASTFRFELPEPAASGNSTSKQPLTPTSPSTPRHDYNDPNIFYVHRDFFATCNEQISVFLDDELEILEEIPGGAWTRVRERQSGGVGLIPTDILESGAERLAKENKALNQDLIRIHSCREPTKIRPCKNSKRKVSFSEKEPQVHFIPYDSSTPDLGSAPSCASLHFPYSIEEESQDALASLEATIYDIENQVEQESALQMSSPPPTFQTPTRTNSRQNTKGFLGRLMDVFRSRSSSRFKDAVNSEGKKILRSLETFPQYEDHLIRVYTGNFDSVLHGFKTFIVDEAVPLADFTNLVVDSFGLSHDGYEYELNLINHMTAEVIPLELTLTVAHIIELTKREALAFTAAMPRELKKAQKKALKKMKTTVRTDQNQLDVRDKTSDYVTPFKFVLNRIYREGSNAPVWIHVHLTGGECIDLDAPTVSGASGLLLNSVTSAIGNGQQQLHSETSSTAMAKKKANFLSKLLPGKRSSTQKQQKKPKNKDSRSSNQSATIDVIERVRINCDESIAQLIGMTLERFQVPSNLPGLYFEASLPAIHDASKLNN